jgi:hypothetical protein
LLFNVFAHYLLLSDGKENSTGQSHCCQSKNGSCDDEPAVWLLLTLKVCEGLLVVVHLVFSYGLIQLLSFECIFQHNLELIAKSLDQPPGVFAVC